MLSAWPPAIAFRQGHPDGRKECPAVAQMSPLRLPLRIHLASCDRCDFAYTHLDVVCVGIKLMHAMPEESGAILTVAVGECYRPQLL